MLKAAGEANQQEIFDYVIKIRSVMPGTDVLPTAKPCPKT